MNDKFVSSVSAFLSKQIK